VNGAATELTAIARELDGATARFKLARDGEPAEGRAAWRGRRAGGGCGFAWPIQEGRLTARGLL